MKKVTKILLPAFFILINVSSIKSISYKNLTSKQKKEFETLITLSAENKIDLFLEKIGGKTNYGFTNVNEPSLVKIVGYNKYGKIIPKKENFIRAIFMYSMLSEVIQQTNNKTNIKRFYRIRSKLEEYIKSGKDYSFFKIPPMVLKTILSTEENKKTSFYWYLYEKIIKQNKILNIGLKESLNWFLSILKTAILNTNLKEVERILNIVPFLVGLKINKLTLMKFSEKHLEKKDYKSIKKILKNAENQFSEIEPSIFTALSRYKLF
ncbi:hypothetical protein GF385_02795 [Candidatus Dependentiae bacterium]|nr:hypothetical protein [Candidatus Dependentiae bacterium]